MGKYSATVPTIRLLLFFSFLFTGLHSASASGWRELTVCKDPKGQSHYFTGPAVPKEKSGSTKDEIGGERCDDDLPLLGDLWFCLFFNAPH